ncbi:MAG: F0F1 ATP synthase subunit A [Clostridium sp.]|jgi:F-type H+-transporting ATPase subunit a|uniref:F0F1 ATP synthase subunit A n=1 Tax=Clostridium sp. TaxID=1506 RepID=UPI0025BB01F0|nr:F0F1 ATP synthase subunit A [Clostridium sp.]MCH3965292.1 F0F1 ATP synthase subunit A [Clostridium sp.]MCI1714513.1 F0F1 ATP synthase subunit A [Clostridium sp.]MCI1798775.1 F0F1 ATP synthase subunit A [Clostridium sp.]MCI1812494.1 F0F1 ATP synthase subunit A [Clostridium sp.]MCI1869585.1 F0F1 ATP synthase subunit A [Clostridium sp.]
MESFSPLFVIHIGSFNVGITSSIIVQWIIILILAILAKVFTANMKKIPDKKQSVVEIIFESIKNLVEDNMGKEYRPYIPYIGTLAIYIIAINILPLIVGVRSPSEDLSVAVGLALITFVLVQFNAIKKIGLKGYFVAYSKPVVPLLPLNIIERVVLPVSLSLRLFGNLTAGAVIVGMVYGGLSHIGWFAQFLVPIPFHAFFDLFDGSIQMIVFVMLTMMNIKVIAEE